MSPVLQQAVQELGLDGHDAAQGSVGQGPLQVQYHGIVAPLQHGAGRHALLLRQFRHPSEVRRVGRRRFVVEDREAGGDDLLENGGGLVGTGADRHGIQVVPCQKSAKVGGLRGHLGGPGGEFLDVGQLGGGADVDLAHLRKLVQDAHVSPGMTVAGDGSHHHRSIPAPAWPKPRWKDAAARSERLAAPQNLPPQGTHRRH